MLLLSIFQTLLCIASTTAEDAGLRHPGHEIMRIGNTEQQSQDKFLYVYEMPKRFTESIINMPLNRTLYPWSLWYNSDQALHGFFHKHSVDSADLATLYFIPVYIEQFHHSLMVNQPMPYEELESRTSNLVLEALQWVQQTFPFWNQTNGVNHFMVLPLDHGRCNSLAGLARSQFGEIFSIQLCGDMMKYDNTGSWPCYQPGRDIIIPSKIEFGLTLTDVVSPHQTRLISVLFRFVSGGRGDYGNLRTRILEAQKERPIEGAVVGWASVEQTHLDMQNSKFCVCPPGIAQHTLRVFRSIVFGCIPITFFQANDSPYERFLGLNYSAFSINFLPSEAHLLQQAIQTILEDPIRVPQLQRNLQDVQKLFVWDFHTEQGVHAAVLQELKLHPAKLKLSVVSE